MNVKFPASTGQSSFVVLSLRQPRNDTGIVIENNRPVVSSRKVAEVFEKEHKRVMQDIRELDCGEEFGKHHFVLTSYKDSWNREKPEYLMTRLGFSVLTMGFTGAKAMQK